MEILSLGNDAGHPATGRRFASSAWEQRKIVVRFTGERQYLAIHLNTEQLFDIVHSDDRRLSRFHSISGHDEFRLPTQLAYKRWPTQ
jgi:hypothetical protein